jgi:signal transduction histidine kinase
MFKLSIFRELPEKFEQLTGVDVAKFDALVGPFSDVLSGIPVQKSDIYFTESPHKLFVALCFMYSKYQDEDVAQTLGVNLENFLYYGRYYSSILNRLTIPATSDYHNYVNKTIRFYQQRVDEMAGIAISADAGISAAKSELRKKNEGLALLNQLQHQVDAKLSVEDAFELVLRNLNTKLRMDGSAILLKSSNHDGMYILNSQFGISKISVGAEISLGDYFEAKGRNIVQNKNSEKTDFTNYISDVLGLPFYVAVPISSHNETFGVLICGRLKEIKPFFPPLNEPDADLLQTLAGYISVSYTNSNMYQVLDRMVQEKTNALVQVQSQIVQSEKMASLGQLTAGIAHEINNPINFVSGNVIPLRRDFERIIELIGFYQELEASSTNTELLATIKKFKQKMDLEFTIEEINMLLEGIAEGANRTLTIVKGLRNFSRLDEADRKRASINDCMESTVTLLGSRIKEFDIEVVKHYASLPNIDCYPGQLNQVLMNIMTNSIQAIKGKGVITLTTEYIEYDELNNAPGYVIIRIKDTGHGMTQEVKDKIFNPFFTTKEVGEGTGLGLSISYGIIKKHEGRIEVVSEVGQGTEFIIVLPDIRGREE